MIEISKTPEQHNLEALKREWKYFMGIVGDTRLSKPVDINDIFEPRIHFTPIKRRNNGEIRVLKNGVIVHVTHNVPVMDPA